MEQKSHQYYSAITRPTEEYFRSIMVPCNCLNLLVNQHTINHEHATDAWKSMETVSPSYLLFVMLKSDLAFPRSYIPNLNFLVGTGTSNYVPIFPVKSKKKWESGENHGDDFQSWNQRA